MNHAAAGPNQAALIAGILIAFPIFFGLLWTGIITFLSRVGSWGTLAREFTSATTPAGEAFGGQTGIFGIASYKRVLTLTIADAGLHFEVARVFAIGHPPLLLPWSEIAGIEPATGILGRGYARIRLSKSLGGEIDIFGNSVDALLAAWRKRQATATT